MMVRSYVLFYHVRHNPPDELKFWFDGDLKAATDRGKSHCDYMGYKFIKVRPFIVDLEAREQMRREYDSYAEEEVRA